MPERIHVTYEGGRFLYRNIETGASWHREVDLTETLVRRHARLTSATNAAEKLACEVAREVAREVPREVAEEDEDAHGSNGITLSSRCVLSQYGSSASSDNDLSLRPSSQFSDYVGSDVVLEAPPESKHDLKFHHTKAELAKSANPSTV
jgi:hypothetical protein